MSSLARIEELEKKYAESPRRFFAPLANEYRKGGDLAKAIELCRASLAQQPNHMSGQVVLGQALFDAGEFEGAREAFEAALQLDPENLIALRHLGDMARAAEDLTAAREWYTRVLDVDPRNHEVVTITRELDELISADAAGAVAEVRVVEPDVEPADAIAYEAPADAPSAVTSFEGDWNPALSPADIAPELVDLSAGQEPPVDSSALEQPVFAEPGYDASEAGREGEEAAAEGADDDYEVDEFWSTAQEVEGIERSGDEEPVLHSALPDVPEIFAVGADSQPAMGVGDGMAGSDSAAAEPLASAEEEANADSEGMHDRVPAAEVDPIAAPELTAAPDTDAEPGLTEQPGSMAEPETGTADDLEDSLAWEMELLSAEINSSLGGVAKEELASGFDILEGNPEEIESEAGSLDALGWDSEVRQDADAGGDVNLSAMEIVDRERPRDSAPAVFITETMAQLYEQQGYFEMAAAVYRQLIERSPSESRFADCLAELEKKIAGSAEKPARRAGAAAYADSTARAFFASLAEVSLRPRLARPYVSSRAEEGESSSRTSSISDAGSPAREASSALSLESVFRSGGTRSGGGANRGNFSFDNFFSGPASAAPAPTLAEKEQRSAKQRRSEQADEIEQFNAWLEGLKRS